MAYDNHIVSGVANPRPTLVIGENHIEYPVNLIFNTPRTYAVGRV